MLISLEAAAAQLDTNERYLYSNPKYNKFVTKTLKGSIRFDMDKYHKSMEEKEKNDAFCIDMVNFAEYVIASIGIDNFYTKIPTLKRQKLKIGFENSKFSLSLAELVKETFEEYYQSYLNGEEIKKDYVPIEKREPLTASFIMNRYWSNQRTTLEIAKELNVPEHWVIDEIRRLGLQKKSNGILVKSGHKGKIMSKEEREKRENQPHSRPIVQICPKTFEIIKEYSSQGAVNRNGFKRESVRKAMKRCGLSGGYLWAFKGLEQATINVAKRKHDIDVRVQVHEYIPPTKEELKYLYIYQGKTAGQIAKKYGCHKNTIARLCSKYKLHKGRSKLTLEKLEEHYLKEKMLAKEIAKMYGLSSKTVTSYLSRNNIKKRKAA